MNPEEPRPQNHLNELPDDSPAVKAAVAELRRRAKQENIQPWSIALSDVSLVRFLRARDFEHDLAWKFGRSQLILKLKLRAGINMPNLLINM